ncbi:MAG TPA: protein kinase [Polyangiaceae bacterium]|nr:protein kinase [Polyangiaceae bacterium]
MREPNVVGRYAIYDKIAQGGMASVHLGRLRAAAGFSRTVAIKRLHPHLSEEPEFLKTIVDEARLAARISHPNVVPTIDVVSGAGELLIVMEYVRGESLSRLLRAAVARGGRPPLAVTSAIVLGALHGLHAAHEATSDRGQPLGIVHRDVSPQNILVGADGVARIIDFGVAKAAGRLQTTREGVIKGKVAYMAPEQLAAAETTRRVDVYAMGVVLWEMLVGRPLFRADSDAALVAVVMAGQVEPPSALVPDLPSGLDALVMTALSREAADRFASAQEMADMLVRVLPPALPTDVGKWVQDLARDALTQRAATLAEIESASGMVRASISDVPPPEAPAVRAKAPERSTDDAPTIASQPSSLSIETPRRSLLPPWRSPRARVVAIAGGIVLTAAVAAILVGRRGGSESPAGAVASSAPAPGTAAPSVAELTPSAVPAAPSSVAQPPDSATPVAATAAPTHAPPATPHPAPRPRRQSTPSPQSSGMVRFSQPD